MHNTAVAVCTRERGTRTASMGCERCLEDFLGCPSTFFFSLSGRAKFSPPLVSARVRGRRLLLVGRFSFFVVLKCSAERCMGRHARHHLHLMWGIGYLIVLLLYIQLRLLIYLGLTICCAGSGSLHKTKRDEDNSDLKKIIIEFIPLARIGITTTKLP